MFNKILNKLSPNPQKPPNQNKTSAELNPNVIIHYGIPSTASRLAYDPIQRILALGTLDGRIKVIGDDNVEGLLISPKSVPFKNVEFLQNQGFLVGVSNENDVMVWDLEHRCIASSLQWQSNITAFSVVHSTNYMYIGDECGSVYVLKYNVEERKLLQLPYQISSQSISETLGVASLNNHSIVGVLSQPCSHGNRVMFAYDNGMIVLWDIVEDKMVLTKGCKELQLKDKSVDDSAKDTRLEQSNEESDDEQPDKEISSLCWASLDGSILAVGYVDGDIILWDLRNNSQTKDHKPENPVSQVFKLQFSSADKRFPVIVLNWCPSTLNKNNSHGGRLFVYGGDEIGTAEVLTVLSLEWASGREALKSVARVDLTLDGSFADMILLRNFDTKENDDMAASLFILTNPGELQFYDDSCLSALVAHQENVSPLPVQYSCIVPTVEPQLTIGRLCSLPIDAEYSKAFLEMASSGRSQGLYVQIGKNTKWPLSGGVPCKLPLSEELVIEKLYIAGYKDGSVRIWDATYPVLLPLFVLGSEIKGVSIAGSTTSVSAMDFSSSTLSLGIGSESGLVRLYSFKNSPNETTLLHVTEAGKEAHVLDQGTGPYCSAVFSFCPSPVSTLRYTNLGDRLVVGYETGQVGILDVGASSVLFLTEAQQLSSVISLDVQTLPNGHRITVNKQHSESEELSEPAKELVFVLRGDSQFSFLDSKTGSMTCSHSACPGKESSAVSMYILDDKSSTAAASGENLQPPSGNNEAKEHAKRNDLSHSGSVEVRPEASGRDAVAGKRPVGSLVLVCSTNRLQLYSLECLFQDDAKPTFEVKVKNTICWTSTCIKDGKECRLIILYQTGVIEIRSLPNLKVIEESSLASIIRWNYKTSMEKTISSTINGQIVMVNGGEFAVISLLSFQKDYRMPQSLPCLHDKTLAAAYSANLAVSPRQKKNKETIPTLFSGLVKGLRSSKDDILDPVEAQKVDSEILERIFFKLPPEPRGSTGKAVELSIDDIHIDEPLRIEPINHQGKPNSKDEKKERDKLLEGGTSNTKPQPRSIDEIKAKYRPVSDAASAAKEARNKLLERQEKLERLTKNTEELQSGAENFASLAQELAKKMENRKWWQM